MGDITYKLLSKEHIQQYRKVRLESLLVFPDNYGTTYDEEYNKPFLLLENNIAQNDNENFMYGAFDNVTLIGICGFVKGDRFRAFHRGDIVHMFVNPAYSGKGIGEKLLRLSVEKVFYKTIWN